MTASPLPRIERTAHGHRLLVDGRPTLLLGGQLHNSTSTDADLPAVLARVAAQSASVVIGTASWELVEPEEGRFDFSSVDAVLAAARGAGLRLLLIWFGAFKNAASTYAPTWVRRDTERFPRAVVRDASSSPFTYPGATPKPVLSVFADALREADAIAFTALMRHLAGTDPQHTVVLVQVENEVGLLGDSRDRSADAERAWAGPVPAALLDGRPAGSWQQVFGDGTDADERFMAWGFGSYVEELARRGKREKDLPMYVNAWLGPQPGQDEPGQYPSGGPASRVLDVWRAAAPSIDLLSPDLYVDDAKAGLAPYVRDDNPLLVPESRIRTGSLFWALGAGAFGFSVFGVEDLRPDSRLSEAYALLGGMVDVITAAQAEGRITGVLLEAGEEATFPIGDVRVTARGSRALLRRMLLDAGVQAPADTGDQPDETAGAPWASPADDRAFGLVIAEEDGALLLVGQNLTLDFARDGWTVEIDSVEAGAFEGDAWRTRRVVNGDERLALLPMEGVGAVRVRLLARPNEGISR